MYREHRISGPWQADVVCVWTSTTTEAAASAVVPDGCADILWSSTRGLVVVGPMTRPEVLRFQTGTAHVGMRLRPGHAPRILGVPAAELTDRILPAADVLGAPGRRLGEQLDDADGAAVRVGTLAALPELEPRRPLDPTVLAALDRFVAHPGRLVEEVASDVGLSPRQLQRRVIAAVGYGPKRFQRVVRVQRVLALGAGALGDLARVAASLGFADQGHLTREVRALTGQPPTVELARRGG